MDVFFVKSPVNNSDIVQSMLDISTKSNDDVVA